jgi:hypothetical protein
VTPEQEEQVRRALRAAARAEEPVQMPPEVTNRLDAVLADLAGAPEGQVGAPGRSTDELASRRNRRRPNLLVAAAAVAVIAVAGGAVATDGFGTLGGGGDVAATSTAKSAAGSQQDSVAPSAGGTRGISGEAAKPRVPSLSSTTLSSDVQRLLRAPHSFTGGLDKAPRSAGKAAVQCARPFTGRGSTLFVVRLDGRAATLVVAPARDGRRQARIYSCDGAGSPLASVSVPAR